ncbi:zinc metalloproteinase nas-14-like [Halichondria panicea]|uniref:zinc metalloproteinase nas-14-like n=1 Tax=Halichondria panicea TaxID=6063 RepID=UPI00312BC1A0
MEDPILPPSSAPILPSQSSKATSSSAISHPGQVCYERVLPSESHFYKPPPPPVRTDDDVCPLPLDAVGFINKLWKKNDLKVYFLTPHPDEDLIISWASEWSNYCAITFTKTTDVTQSDVRVAFNDAGSWSYIGTDSTRIPLESFSMNLGFVDRPTVLHEFGHALGLIHEHQSPFKGGFEWDREEVIKSLSGPPNYWDPDRIENNMFKRYNRKDLDGTLYDAKSIMHYSFPRSWIKGKGYPNGIDRNDELSERDKEHIKRLYGPPKGGPRIIPITTSRGSGRGSTGPGRPTTTVTRVVPTLPERHKPVTSLPPPRTDSIHDVQVYEPHKGELSGPGAELLIRFHTSKDDRPRYTIQTHGDCDMILALLGPNDYTKLIKVDDDSGDRTNAKIVERLMPDKDYYLQIQTFKPEGGKFEFSITSW